MRAGWRSPYWMERKNTFSQFTQDQPSSIHDRWWKKYGIHGNLLVFQSQLRELDHLWGLTVLKKKQQLSYFLPKGCSVRCEHAQKGSWSVQHTAVQEEPNPIQASSSLKLKTSSDLMFGNQAKWGFRVYRTKWATAGSAFAYTKESGYMLLWSVYISTSWSDYECPRHGKNGQFLWRIFACIRQADLVRSELNPGWFSVLNQQPQGPTQTSVWKQTR